MRVTFSTLTSKRQPSSDTRVVACCASCSELLRENAVRGVTESREAPGREALACRASPANHGRSTRGSTRRCADGGPVCWNAATLTTPKLASTPRSPATTNLLKSRRKLAGPKPLRSRTLLVGFERVAHTNCCSKSRQTPKNSGQSTAGARHKRLSPPRPRVGQPFVQRVAKERRRTQLTQMTKTPG